MPILPVKKSGDVLEIRDKPIEFTHWPTYRGIRRFGLQSNIFSSDPFSMMSSAIRSGRRKRHQSRALSFIQQARYMYDASEASREPAAKPLLLYYSFMNMAKAFYIHRTGVLLAPKVYHGLSAVHLATNRLVESADVEAHGCPDEILSGPTAVRTNIFDEFIVALQGMGFPTKRKYRISKLMPQIVAGHRIWSIAVKQAERFIGLEKIEFVHDRDHHNLWIRFYVFSDTLARFGLTHRGFLRCTQLDRDFRPVKCNDQERNRSLTCFEQEDGQGYSHRPSDIVGTVARNFGLNVWSIVSSVPPYRRYYLYACPVKEHDHVLPQLASMYAVAFYLGSITRYRPDDFDKLLSGTYGPFIQDFLSWIGGQFTYLLASEFCERDVTKAAVV